MASQNIVSANVVFQQGAVAPAPLDIELVGITLTAPQDALWGPNLIREVDSETWQDVLAEVGITDGEPAYEYVQQTFAGSVVARLVLLGKTATPVAQVVNFDLGLAGAAADGLYRLTINGENFDVNAVTQTRAQIVTAMIAAFPGLQPVLGAAGGDPEQIDVSALAAGTGFSFAASAPAGETWTVLVSQTNVGVPTDLVAWNDEDPRWYLYTRPEPFGYDEANGVASTVQSFPRDITAWVRTDNASDPLAATSGAGRVAARLALLGYSRTVVTHVTVATAYDWAAIISDRLTTTPGSTTWALQVLAGVAGTQWTSPQAANLIAGPYAYFDQITSISGAISQNIRVVDSTPFDLIRGSDYLKASVIAAVLTGLLQADKIPYSGPGFGEIGGWITGVLTRFAGIGFILAELEDGSPGWTVIIPTVVSQTAANRAARKVEGFGFTAQVAGAVEIVDNIGGILEI